MSALSPPTCLFLSLALVCLHFLIGRFTSSWWNEIWFRVSCKHPLTLLWYKFLLRKIRVIYNECNKSHEENFQLRNVSGSLIYLNPGFRWYYCNRSTISYDLQQWSILFLLIAKSLIHLWYILYFTILHSVFYLTTSHG